MLILTFLLAIGATGWNIMGGFAGYISLGNSAFIGLGAYTTGILAAKDNLSPFLGCLAGGLALVILDGEQADAQLAAPDPGGDGDRQHEQG